MSHADLNHEIIPQINKRKKRKKKVLHHTISMIDLILFYSDTSTPLFNTCNSRFLVIPSILLIMPQISANFTVLPIALQHSLQKLRFFTLTVFLTTANLFHALTVLLQFSFHQSTILPVHPISCSFRYCFLSSFCDLFKQFLIEFIYTFFLQLL